MNEHSCNSKGSSAHAGNPDARWRTLFMALVLAPIIGSVCPTLPAHAAPGQAGVESNEYYLTPSGAGGLDRVCVGGVVVSRTSCAFSNHSNARAVSLAIR